jgi:Transposase DDE domain
MTMVAKVVAAMERVLGEDLDGLAEKHKVVVRKRKFTGETLLKMLVMTLLKKPDAVFSDLATTAAQLGVSVSATAVEKRFTQPLIDFLRAVLDKALKELVAAEPTSVALLQRFTAVFIGDSSSIALPDKWQELFPGCGGTEGSGKAALKLQVRWDLRTGELPLVLIEAGRASDAKSEIIQQDVPAGAVEIFDLGYFSIPRFRRLDEGQAYFISRLQYGTTVLDEQGQPISLCRWLATQTQTNVVDRPILLGAHDRLPCRLIAIRLTEESANRRRQKARENAVKHGRVASAEHLEQLGWSLYVTNLTEEQLTWKEVVVLSRARWQIELLFKLWKSHNLLAQHRAGATPEEALAVLWAKLIGILLQHWLLLSATWPNDRRSLFKAASALRDWITSLLMALDNHDQLVNTVTRIHTHLNHTAKTQSRKKKPSHFQLLRNPELLDWAA